MESLNLSQYLPYLLLFMGLATMAMALFYKSGTKNLEATGERCEGIVFKLGYQSNAGFDIDNTPAPDKVTIRFVTKDREWITEDLHNDFAMYYTGQYKEGDKVSVVYNPANPHEFTVGTRQSLKAGKLLTFIIGAAFTGAAIYKLCRQA